MAQYTDAQIAGVCKWAGFSGDRLVTAIAVALGESGGNLDAKHTNTNGTVDRGLWQINSVHKNISDDCAFSAFCSTRQAFLMSGGGRNWRPWVAYTSGRYRQFLSRARVAAGKPAEPPTRLEQSGPLLDLKNPISGLTNALQDVGRFFGALLNPQTWVRVAQVLGGFSAIIIGLYILTKDEMPGTVKKAAMLAITKGKAK